MKLHGCCLQIDNSSDNTQPRFQFRNPSHSPCARYETHALHFGATRSLRKLATHPCSQNHNPEVLVDQIASVFCPSCKHPNLTSVISYITTSPSSPTSTPRTTAQFAGSPTTTSNRQQAARTCPCKLLVYMDEFIPTASRVSNTCGCSMPDRGRGRKRMHAYTITRIGQTAEICVHTRPQRHR